MVQKSIDELEKKDLDKLSKPELLTISRNMNLDNTFKNTRDEVQRSIEFINESKRRYFKNSLYVNVDSANEKDCVEQFSKWHLGEKLAKGGFARIMNVCKINPQNANKECGYVMKSQNITTKYFREAFYTEVDIFNAIKGKNIGPDIVSSWICYFDVSYPGYGITDKDDHMGDEYTKDKYGNNDGNINPDMSIGYIVMDKWDGTLHDVITAQGNKISKKQLDVIERLILEFHKTGWVHRDLKTNNILYKIIKDSNGKKSLQFGITDFSISKKIGSKDFAEVPFSLAYQYKIEDKYKLVNDYTTRPEVDFFIFKLYLKNEYKIATTQFDKYMKKIIM